MTTRHRRFFRAAIASAALAAAAPAGAQNIFTGLQPVYLGAWFNGSFTERVELQFLLDWQGWCKARAGAVCDKVAYWNVAGNWENNAIPSSLSNDVRIGVGQTVRIADFLSIYRGFISPIAGAGTLFAEGRVELGNIAKLTVGNASFADLHFFPGGILETSGLSTVYNLSSGAGEFRGAGVTELRAWQPSTLGQLDLLVKSGHTLRLASSAPGAAVARVRIEPNARLENTGVLNLGGGGFSLQGSANGLTLPVFENLGTLTGAGSVQTTRFNNKGSVLVAAGDALRIGMFGTHTGSFDAGLGSSLSFGGTGGSSGSNWFQTHSSLVSTGLVVAGRGDHFVDGSWDVETLEVSGGGRITFNSTPQIRDLRVVISFGQASFNGTVGALNLRSVLVDGGGRVDFNAGTANVQSLNLNNGGLAVQSSLRVTDAFDWANGFISGIGTLALEAPIRLLAGTRGFSPTVLQTGTLDWQAGSFTHWNGEWRVASGSSFNIGGDFNATGTGSLLNSGTLVKQAGTGRATFAVAVNSNGGTQRALAGTLALTGGGRYLNPNFIAAAGAAIELGGAVTFEGQVLATGRLDILASRFELMNGTDYRHALGNRFEIGSAVINPSARLDVPMVFSATGSVINLGVLHAGSDIRIGGDFAQRGVFTATPGASFEVGGVFSNGARLMLNGPVRLGALTNEQPLALVGNSVTASLGTLNNTSTLNLRLSGLSGPVLIAGGSNSGEIRVDFASVAVESGAGFVNQGLIVNKGQWHAEGMDFAAGSRFDNSGTLRIGGGARVFTGAQIGNTAALILGHGVFSIEAGATVGGAGSFEQFAGFTDVRGVLRADAGLTIWGGVLRGGKVPGGVGAVIGNVLLGATAKWEPGNSPGTFTVVGNVDLRGLLEIEFMSPQLRDLVVVSGDFTAHYGSKLNLVFDRGFSASDGDVLPFLQVAGTLDIGPLQTTITGLPSQFSVSPNSTPGVIEIFDLRAQPLPGGGSFAIAMGTTSFNGYGGASNLNLLEVRGTLSNRTGANLTVQQLRNDGQVNQRGTLTVFGTIDNRANVLAPAGSQTWGNYLDNSGTWTQAGTGDWQSLINRAGATMVIDGRMDMRDALDNQGTLRIGGTFTSAGVLNTGALTVNAGGSLTSNGQVVNRGSLTIDAGGSLVSTFSQGQSGAADYYAFGGPTVVNGLLQADLIRIQDNLSGSGTLRGRVEADVIRPGNSLGTLTIDGDLVVSALELELASASSFDRLVVSGSADIQSVWFTLLADFQPVIGDSFQVLSVSGSLTSSFWRVSSPAGFTWADANGYYGSPDPSGLTTVVTFSNGLLSVTAVPEPANWMLLAGGIFAIAFRLSRRRAAT